MAGNYVEELVAFLGWEVDSKELDGFNDQVKSVTDTVKTVAVAVGAAAAGVATFVTLTNKATAVTLGMAQANEVAAETAEDLGRMLSIIGMDTRSVIKSFAFLNKTMGGIKTGAVSATVVDKSLKGVGLRLQEIQKLTPEDQFVAVMEAARGTEDAQVAAAAATALFGREAGKMVGFFRTQTKTVRELLEIQNQMNLQTEEGRAGALRFFGALDLLEAAGQSVRESLAGLIGGGLAPLMEGWVEWIAANRELLQLKIAEWADRITKAFTWFVRGVKWVVTNVTKLVDTMGGLENVLKLIGVAAGAMFTARVISMVVTFTKAVKSAGIATALMNAGIALTPLLIAGVVALLFLLGEDLYQFFTGGESLLGDLGDKIAEFAHMNIRPFIASLLGMTPEELDLAMVKVVSSVTNFFTKTIPGVWSEGVLIIENLIQGFVDKIWPILNSIYDFYVDVYTRIKDFVTGIAGAMYNTIVGNFDKAIAKVKGALNAIPGLDKVLDLNTTVAPATAGLGATAGARAVASSITNSVQRSSAVNVSSPITVTQQPGQSGTDLARQIADELGKAVSRAAKRADSGREV